MKVDANLRQTLGKPLAVPEQTGVSRGKLKASGALPDGPPATAHQHGDPRPIGCTEPMGWHLLPISSRSRADRLCVKVLMSWHLAGTC